MIYDRFRPLFPPRPEIKTPPSSIDTYERMGFWGQPKMNGSCAVLYTNGTEMKFMNRHLEPFARNIIPIEDLMRLHKGVGYQVLVGEYLNKSKKDAHGRTFNGCLVIFDIIVSKGQYLTGSTMESRQELLDNLFHCETYNKYLDKVSNNIYRVKNFRTNLKELFYEVTKIDVFEGWVLKNPKGILETGYRPLNNAGWQLKTRKACKLYSY